MKLMSINPTVKRLKIENYAHPSKIRQNRMKIVEVSQSHVVDRGVGWLGWSNFFYRLILRVDHQDKPPHKISTQYLKAFRS